jgi:hypothetical protein
VNAAHFDRLAELALKDKASLHDSLAAPKVGPWDTHREFSQYTKQGTALRDYEVLALEVGTVRTVTRVQYTYCKTLQ